MNYRVRNCGGVLTLHEAGGPKPTSATEPAQKSCKSGGSSPEPKKAEKTDERGTFIVPSPRGDGTFRRVTETEAEEDKGRETARRRQERQRQDAETATLPYYEQRERLERELGIQQQQRRG